MDLETEVEDFISALQHFLNQVGKSGGMDKTSRNVNTHLQMQKRSHHLHNVPSVTQRLSSGGSGNDSRKRPS